jgi:hypothetical protein
MARFAFNPHMAVGDSDFREVECLLRELEILGRAIGRGRRKWMDSITRKGQNSFYSQAGGIIWGPTQAMQVNICTVQQTNRT